MAFVNTQVIETKKVGEWMGNVLAKWNDARERRATYLRVKAELEASSDRDLADMGMSRLQIRDIALQAAYGERA